MIENKKTPLSKNRIKYNIDISSIRKEDSRKEQSEKEETTTTSENTQNNLNNEKQVYQKDEKQNAKTVKDEQINDLPNNKEEMFIIIQNKNNKNLNNKKNLQTEINKNKIDFDEENLKKLNPKINNNLHIGINNLFRNQLKFNNFQYNQVNNPFVLNNFNSNNAYNPNSNYYHIQKLALYKEQKLQFTKLKELGLLALNNANNINHYLLNTILNSNNIFNCMYNTNYFNNFIPFNNNINYNFNNYENQILLTSIMNMNNINNLNALNNLTNSINPKKYTITLKSKTNNPNVDKISKIKITTTFKKDNIKAKVENNTQVIKEKKIKNKINIEEIKSGNETRTVVRLNPIPLDYSSYDISRLLDKYLEIEGKKNKRIYKAIYTPLCKVIGKNLGFCFVMMTNPKYVIKFFETFSVTTFGLKKCNKPCNVIWADIQGEDFLRLNKDDPSRKPIIFKDIISD